MNQLEQRYKKIQLPFGLFYIKDCGNNFHMIKYLDTECKSYIIRNLKTGNNEIYIKFKDLYFMEKKLYFQQIYKSSIRKNKGGDVIFKNGVYEMDLSLYKKAAQDQIIQKFNNFLDNFSKKLDQQKLRDNIELCKDYLDLEEVCIYPDGQQLLVDTVYYNSKLIPMLMGQLCPLLSFNMGQFLHFLMYEMEEKQQKQIKESLDNMCQQTLKNEQFYEELKKGVIEQDLDLEVKNKKQKKIRIDCLKQNIQEGLKKETRFFEGQSGYFGDDVQKYIMEKIIYSGENMEIDEIFTIFKDCIIKLKKEDDKNYGKTKEAKNFDVFIQKKLYLTDYWETSRQKYYDRKIYKFNEELIKGYLRGRYNLEQMMKDRQKEQQQDSESYYDSDNDFEREIRDVSEQEIKKYENMEPQFDFDEQYD